MKAISIRQPWAWAILHAGKDIENRDWLTRHRGPVLLHASKWWRPEEVQLDFRSVVRKTRIPVCELPPVTLNDMRAMCGHIFAKARIIECTMASNSPWFVGQWGFVLYDVQPVKLTPYRGALGLFDVPDDLAREIGATT